MTQDERLDKAATLASSALVSGGTLAMAAFGYFFYHYTLTGQRQFISSIYLIVYYLLPLTAAVLLFAALRLAPTHRINAFLFVVTSTLCLYGLELAMDWRASSLYISTLPVMTILADSSDKQRDAAALKAKWGVDVDTRTADEVLSSLRTGGVDPVPIMTPTNHLVTTSPDGSVHSVIRIEGREVLPLAGVSNRLTLLCSDAGQWVHYQSDGRGFNNSERAWRLDRLDIAAVGDSFTQGYCVPPEHNFVALIRQHHPATLNLGIAGDGPLMMLATLEEHATRFKPKVVLWFYFEGNDLVELQNERRNPLLSQYLTDGFTQTALAEQSEIDSAILAEMPRLRALEQRNRENRLRNSAVNGLADFTRLSTLRAQLGLVGGISTSDAGAFQKPNLDALRDVLSKAQTQVGGWGGQLVFVYLPDWSRYAGYSAPGAMQYQDVLAVARGLGLTTVDIHAAFQAHGDPLSNFPFRRAAHYNDAGHRVVAEEVLKTLTAETSP